MASPGRARTLLSGNEAVARGALDAGCSFYAGYPITPSSEIMDIMARELPARGGVFIQAEDELAAINMVIGASWAGARAMTATSGPGFSLMQEGIGYAVMTETPLVVVDVMRVGPATGQAAKPAQSDLMQARWGRHGDQYVPVLAASDQQEAYDLVIKAFDIAERLRTPVVLLSDEFIAHGRGVVYVWERPPEVSSRRRPTSRDEPPFYSEDPRTPPPMPPLGEGFSVMVTGSTHDGRGLRDTSSYEVHWRLVTRLKEKIWGNIGEVFMAETEDLGDPRVAIVCFGSVCRSAREAFKRLGREGVGVRLVKLTTLWPMDYRFLEKTLGSMDHVVVPEMNLGQLVYDIATIVGWDRVVSINRVGGGVPIYPSEIAGVVKRLVGV